MVGTIIEESRSRDQVQEQSLYWALNKRSFLRRKVKVKNHLEDVKIFHDLESSSYTNERYNDKSCEGLAYLTRKKILLELIKLMPKGRILDIGCGPGILTSDLLNEGMEVFSIDLSKCMLANAQASIQVHPRRKHAEFLNCEASRICFRNESLRSIMCIGVLYYVEDYNATMREVCRMLEEGGTAIIQIDKFASPLLFNILNPVYRWIKTRVTGKKYDNMTFNKNVFSYKKFLNDMEQIGFRISGIEYYDLRFPFIDILAPNVSVRIGKWLFNHRKMKIARYLSYGMLISLKKIGIISK